MNVTVVASAATGVSWATWAAAPAGSGASWLPVAVPVVAVAAAVLSYLQTLDGVKPAPSRSEVRELLAELTISMRQTRADAICILDVDLIFQCCWNQYIAL
jgi:CTP:molybdopterin cytidylyltransferase MocA